MKKKLSDFLRKQDFPFEINYFHRKLIILFEKVFSFENMIFHFQGKLFICFENMILRSKI